MKQYLNLLQNVLLNGQLRPNRTGVKTLSQFGAHLSFDLAAGFPAITTKRLAFKSVVAELLGFLRGCDNAKQFRSLGTGIWDANANAPKWQTNASCKGPDDLGRIYGVQWRRWKTHKPVFEPSNSDPSTPYLIAGYEHYDQLADVLDRARKDPYDRRLIVSAWNAAEIHNEEMALPPCHILFQLYPDPIANTLSLSMYQRSADLFLGVPFNIASYALLTDILAAHLGYQPGRLEMFLGDAHIYEDHIPQVKLQLAREPHPLPDLRFTPRSNLKDYTPEDFRLTGYDPHGAIPGKMAV